MQGSWSTSPQTGGLLASGAIPIGPTPLDQQLVLDEKDVQQYTLASDSPQAISFDGVTNCHVLIVSCDEKVRLRVTTADGAQQSVPVDPLAIFISRSVPITAADVTRVPSTSTDVTIFLGEVA